MRKDNALNIIVLLPIIGFFVAFFLFPIVFLVGRVFSGSGAIESFSYLLASPVFRTILYNTLLTGFVVTLITLVIAFPISWYLVIANDKIAKIAFGIIVISMWTSFLARLFSVSLLYSDSGPLNKGLINLGLISTPIPIVRTFGGVIIGMFYTMLPFMVLPIYNTMVKIDPMLMRAASICGARRATIFWRVLLPLSLPGISVGCVIVFVTTMGYFIVPAIMGGAGDMMLAEYIVSQVQQFLNWEMGAAAAVYLLVLTIAMYVGYAMIVGFATRRGRQP